MSLVRWEPFRDLMGLRRTVDQMVDDVFDRPWGLFDGRRLLAEHVPIDVYQTDNEFIVKAALPGVKPENVDLTITGSTLTIKGETKEEQEVKEESYLHREHRYGAFSRTIALPGQLNTDGAEASFENGIMTVTIPKAEEAKSKSIRVSIKK